MLDGLVLRRHENSKGVGVMYDEGIGASFSEGLQAFEVCRYEYLGCKNCLDFRTGFP